MQRYFIEENYQPQADYQLSGEAFHHIARVMRMKVGEQIYVVFANQQSILAEITNISEEAVTIKELSKESMTKELPVNITIASGFPKGDKLEWIIQKGTELGAHGFIGFPAKTSIVKWEPKKLVKKQQRLEKIAQEAAEQSQRVWSPTVELLTSEKDFLQCLKNYTSVLVAYEESAKSGEQKNLVAALQKIQPGENILAVFGPEGGLSSEEIRLFEDQGAILCGLGPRILRAETAPLYLLSAASYALELAQPKD